MIESVNIPKDIFGKLMPDELSEYYQKLNQQHFGKKTYGSRFYMNPDTGAKNIEELLQKALTQRGTLDGDDRAWFMSHGVSEKVLLPDHRYLKVDAEGKMGIKKASDFSPDTKVTVLQLKPGDFGSLVAEVDSDSSLPEVDFGTIIVGPRSQKEPGDILKTTHPGAPAKPLSELPWANGTRLTMGEVVEKLGPDQVIVLRTKVSAMADSLDSFSKELGVPPITDRINRGLDPIGMFAAPELRKKIKKLCDKMEADENEVLAMVKTIHLSGPWSYAEKLQKAQDPVIKVWLILNAVNTMGKPREKDLTEKELMEDYQRLRGLMDSALQNPVEFFETKAKSHVLETSKTQFHEEDGVPISELSNGFISMGILGHKAGVYQDPDGTLFVGSANEIPDSLVEQWGLKVVKEVDRRVVQGKTLERTVTYYRNQAGENLVRKIHPGFAVVDSRNLELAKSLVRASLDPKSAPKPSDDALGHKIYTPSSMKEGAEVTPDLKQFLEGVRGQLTRLIEKLPSVPENAPLNERFYAALRQVKLMAIYADASRLLWDKKKEKGQSVTEKDLMALWDKQSAKMEQKLDELKYLCEVLTKEMPNIPKRASRIMDMAGGAGDLGLAYTMAMLEAGRPPKETLIVDPVAELAEFFDGIVKYLPESETLKKIARHHTVTLQEAPLSGQDIVVAKHPCGTLSDNIIENWVASESPLLIIMTCCQDKAKDEPARYDISQENWHNWCKASSKTNSDNPKQRAEGMEAMTKLDTARVDYLRRHGFDAELIQNTAFPKGDVIIARRSKY